MSASTALVRLVDTPWASLVRSRGQQLLAEGDGQGAMRATLVLWHGLSGVNEGTMTDFPTVKIGA